MNEILELEEKSRALEKEKKRQLPILQQKSTRISSSSQNKEVWHFWDWNLADKSSQTYAQKKVHQTENH